MAFESLTDSDLQHVRRARVDGLVDGKTRRLLVGGPQQANRVQRTPNHIEAAFGEGPLDFHTLSIVLKGKALRNGATQLKDCLIRLASSHAFGQEACR